MATNCYRVLYHWASFWSCTLCSVCHCTQDNQYNQGCLILSTYIRFPCGQVLANAVKDFKEKRNLIQCVGVIDGSHVPVRPSELNQMDYYNMKGWYSVIIQAA